ncbi:hypothetical protein DEO72_LG5g1719 [Vigna unguiculata]|uniref:Uncharacterized protein n=1 Tax=Vigna unguiculata TaxID=3917 RepID=A0A4D6LYR7_VIGUN|nr:hypothetical protein DEO72_LG5g1719 [Vigna unguiculata]
MKLSRRWLTMEEDGVAMMVVGFPVSCAAAVAAERGCRSAREVRCIVVAAAVRTKKMVLRRLLDGSRSPA